MMELEDFEGPDDQTIRDEWLLSEIEKEERAKCNLNLQPGKNWVEKSGGLPAYIHSIACALVRDGKTVQNAIQIAVSRAKVWCGGGGDVNADTRAKACAAVAEWEAKKAGKRSLEMEMETRESVGVKPEGDPDKRMFAARVLNYNVVDDHGTSWAPGVFADSLRAKKPPAVWGHDPRRPIGRLVDYRDTSEGLDVIVQLADFDAVPDARMAHALLNDDIIDQFSFGFHRESDEDDPNNRGATRITKATMLEVSPVLVASGKGTRTLAVRSTTRAQAAELLGKVAAGEIDAQTALEQLAELREPEVKEEVRESCCLSNEEVEAEIRSIDKMEW